MLTNVLGFIFDVILFLITVASWLVLIYVIMALVVPQNKYTLLVGRFVEPVLTPIRKFLFRIFPRLREIGVDFSPLIVYVLIQIISWLVRLLHQVLL